MKRLALDRIRSKNKKAPVIDAFLFLGNVFTGIRPDKKQNYLSGLIVISIPLSNNSSKALVGNGGFTLP